VLTKRLAKLEVTPEYTSRGDLEKPPPDHEPKGEILR
jgi:hypothetical protein